MMTSNFIFHQNTTRFKTDHDVIRPNEKAEHTNQDE